MINLKKMVAVALSTAMCLGLSMTAFAVDSPITPEESVAQKYDVFANDVLWANTVDGKVTEFVIKLNDEAVDIKVDDKGDLWCYVDENGQLITSSLTTRGFNGSIYGPGVRLVRVLAGNQFASYDSLVNGSLHFTRSEAGALVGHLTTLEEYVTDQYGNRKAANASKLTAQSIGSISNDKKIRDIMIDAGYDIPADWTIIPVAADRITLDSDLPSGGAYAWVDVQELGNEVQGYVAGQTIQILRETFAGSGEWEVVDAELVKCGDNGELRARVQLTNRDQSLVVLRIMSDGRSIAVVNRATGDRTIVPVTPGTTTAVSNSSSASATAAPQASPKTGEF